MIPCQQARTGPMCQCAIGTRGPLKTIDFHPLWAPLGAETLGPLLRIL